MLLAIDTATRWAGLALYDQAKGMVLGEEMWHSVNNHTVELMPRAARMMDQQEISPAELDGLVVSLGPGSFTGLRIGLGLAKGLALAHTLPLVGVATLEAVARPHARLQIPILAVLQAGRGRVCAAPFGHHTSGWRRIGPYELTTLDELCDSISQATFICGEIDAHGERLIVERLGELATIASPAERMRRAAHLAELGWERLARGDADDIASLSPIYLHHPQIDS